MVKGLAVKALTAFCLLTFMLGLGMQAAAQSPKDFVSVDAARYQLAVAPNSIAAGFTYQVTAQVAVATDADPDTPGIQLPTLLGGVRVTVNNRPAGLLVVSPNQINYVVPADTEVDGPATVVVSDDQGNILAQGTLSIATSELSIFTARQDGSGPPAALFTGDGVTYNAVANVDGSANVVPAGDYLILFCTGLRGAGQDDVKAFIGGVEAPVFYSGAQPDFVALDQANIQIPASLANQGLLELTLTNGSTTSNTVTIDLGGNPAAPVDAPVITGFSNDTALASQVVTLTGSNFATDLASASVRIGSASGQVVSTSATSMTFIVPYGAATDKVTAGNAAGERQSDATLNITTSLSGTIISQANDPLPGVVLTVGGTNITTTTDNSGRFLLPNLSAGVVWVSADPSGIVATPPFVNVSFGLVITAGRDNQLGQPIALPQEAGNAVTLNGVNGSQLQSAQPSADAGSTTVVVEHEGLKLEIPGAITFPDGKSTGRIGLTRLSRDNRLPKLLPSGVYPSVVALITPMGATFGAKDGTGAATLTFPNPDQFPAGAVLDLYSYRPTVTPSAFVKKGTATVNSTGDKIVATGLIDLATVWFVGVPSTDAPVTKVTGQVTDSNDKPVSGAHVFVRGRGAETDKEGKFVISGVRAKNNDELHVEAYYFTPAGVPLKASKTVNAVVPGETNAGVIKLSAEPPLAILIRPMEVKINAGETVAMKVVLSKPLSAPATINLAKGEGVDLTIEPSSVTIKAGETEANFSVKGSTPGRSIVTARLAATVDNIAPDQARAGYAAVYVLLPAPVLSSISPDNGAPGSTFTITGTGFSTEAQRNYVFFKQGDYAAPVDPKSLKVSGTTSIQGAVPGLKAGAADVYVVRVQEGVPSALSNKLTFTVKTASAPVLTAITPSEGTPRTPFTITGSGFDPDPRRNGVFFKQGDKLLPVNPDMIKVTNTTIEGVVPPLPAGAADVFVATYHEGTPSALSNKLSFMVKALPGPVLSAITPDNGTPGTAFKITGTGFSTEARRNYVIFKQGDHNSYLDPSLLKVTDTTSIEGTIPRMPAGAAEVFVIVGAEGTPPAQSNHLTFTVNAPPAPPAPVLSAITPNEGTPGTAFKITGTGFGPINGVFFKQGDHVVTASSTSLRLTDTGLEGVVPSLPAGAAEVYVVARKDDVSSPESNHLAFTVKAPSAPPAPVLTAITPSDGAAPGASFQITGTGFASYNVVFFKQGDHVVPAVQSSVKVTDTGVQGIVPDLPAGAAEVYVITARENVPSPQSNHLSFMVKAKPTI